MHKLIIRQRAANDAREAWDWYEDKRTGLGEEFLEEVNKCYAKIELWPLHYTKVKDNVHQVVLKRFPFVVTYKVYEETVVVYAVFHTSQDPHKKFNR